MQTRGMKNNFPSGLGDMQVEYYILVYYVSLFICTYVDSFIITL